MRFVINLTVNPAFYIVLERLHDPLAVARRVSCRSRVGEVPWRIAGHNHLGILFAGFLTGKTRMSGGISNCVRSAMQWWPVGPKGKTYAPHAA
jgi:hypothetical protein